MSEKEKQTKEELERQLSEQIQFLETSADLFDQGTESEAKRMAGVLRTLLHDTQTCKSLLGQLGIKGKQFLDTAHENISNVITSHCALVQTLLPTAPGKPPKYVALLDNAQGKMVDFVEWWNAIVIKDMEDHNISRKDLIVTMANQDGGVHIDSSIDKGYSRLKKGESLGHMYSDGRSWTSMQGAELASVRQITHEVLKTLKPSYEKKPSLPQNGIILFGGFRLEFKEK